MSAVEHMTDADSGVAELHVVASAIPDQTPDPHRAQVVMPTRGRLFVQRSFDLALGLPAAVLATPIVAVLAVCSAWSFRAWPFFVQDRLGRNRSTMRFVKIRSLPLSAPAYTDKYDLQEVQNTRYGQMIRGLHLDELPQLYLVVTGKMSLVGPRPEMESLADRFDPDFVEQRLVTRPGCTGLWQVSADAGKLIGECPEYDLFYVANQSLLLDCWVMIQTAKQFLGSKRRHVLSDLPARFSNRERFASAGTRLSTEQR